MESNHCLAIAHRDGIRYLYIHAEPRPHVHCNVHGNTPGYEHCDSNPVTIVSPRYAHPNKHPDTAVVRAGSREPSQP